MGARTVLARQLVLVLVNRPAEIKVLVQERDGAGSKFQAELGPFLEVLLEFAWSSSVLPVFQHAARASYPVTLTFKFLPLVYVSYMINIGIAWHSTVAEDLARARSSQRQLSRKACRSSRTESGPRPRSPR